MPSVDGLQYALLTDSISEGIFGLKTKKHKKVKAFKSNHNLRDHMSPVELAVTMLGETTTVELGASETCRECNTWKTPLVVLLTMIIMVTKGFA